MRRSVAVLAALSLAIAAAGCRDLSTPTQPQAAPGAGMRAAVVAAPGERVVAGEVLVTVRHGVDVRAVAAAHGLSFARNGYHGRFAVLHGAVGQEHANAAALSRVPGVVYAEPNYLRQTTGTFNPDLWAFYNPGGLTMSYTQGRYKGQPLPSSYSSTYDADQDDIVNWATGGSNVVIGSIDTGVDFSHPEFTGRLIPGYDWYNNDNDPSDDEGHGTHTTGTMAGTTVGVPGVAGDASHVFVYVQKVCGSAGCPTSAIVDAIYAAADFNADHSNAPGPMVAMNLSLGGSSESQTEAAAIAYAVDTANVLVIASAGNDGTGAVSCPACDVNAISVAATNWRDTLTYYSNWGPGLDIAAPGGECYSNTTPEGCIYSAYLGGGYAWLQGTSMAAPQVTGTAALVASEDGLRGSALRDRILSTTDHIGDASHYGNGRLNTYRAVTGNTLSASADTVPGSGGGTTNQPPTASFTDSCSGLGCTFTDQSSDPDGTIAAWAWDFGDGATSTAQNPSHTYAAAGTYTVTLTVTDNGGATGSTSQSITVGSPTSDNITLTVNGVHKGPNAFAQLGWTGASAASIDVYRDLGSGLQLIGTTSNNGQYSDKLGKNFTGTVVYEVCDAGTQVCSNTASVTF